MNLASLLSVLVDSGSSNSQELTCDTRESSSPGSASLPVPPSPRPPPRRPPAPLQRHPVYPFPGHHAGQVPGPGCPNFFVAPPGLTPLTPSSAGTAPAGQAGGGLGY